MNETKAGDKVDFTVDGQTLVVEPLPYGNLKKIMRTVFAIGKDIQSGQLADVATLADKYMGEVLPLLFRKDKYPFMTNEWIDEHMTLPVLRKIMETAIQVNGLEDFFVRAGLMVKIPKLNPTQTTPSEKDGSITSSGSPTDGVPKT